MNDVSKNKKVLLLIDSIGPGGAQRQLVGLASFLKDKGYNVTIAVYHDIRFYENQLIRANISYVYLGKAHKSLFRIWYIARYIRNFNPNVVISFLETPSICTCIARFFNHRFKLIVSERNTTQHTGRNERIRFNLFRIADYVVPNAYSQETYMRETFPRLTNKIVTIPNFVDLEYFVPPFERKRREVPEIMIAASIWPSKNTLGFIDTVSILKERGCGFHIVWYGKSESNIDYYKKCQEKVYQLGLEYYISLKEKTFKIKECYQDADLFCLPSFYEGTPNVICEAMACGVPIVCSDVCDNSRYVEDGVNGCLFDPHNAVSMANALERMLSMTEADYMTYCQNSRERAEKLLSKDRFVESYINLIEQ